MMRSLILIHSALVAPVLCVPARDVNQFLESRRGNGARQTFSFSEQELRDVLVATPNFSFLPAGWENNNLPFEFTANPGDGRALEFTPAGARAQKRSPVYCRAYFSGTEGQAEIEIVCGDQGGWFGIANQEVWPELEKSMLGLISQRVAQARVLMRAPDPSAASDGVPAASAAPATCPLRDKLAQQQESDEAAFQEALHSPRKGRELPESVHELKVKANLAVKQERFNNAAENYAKALGIAPWWPQGRYNYAVILGKINCVDEAIREMERYLLLVPKAQNARKAKDQIYEWKALKEAGGVNSSPGRQLCAWIGGFERALIDRLSFSIRGVEGLPLRNGHLFHL